MEQRSVTIQTTRPATTTKTRRVPYWLHFFFTDDLSPDNHATIDLQRRAVWVALALLLLSPTTLDYNWFSRVLTPAGSIIPILLAIGSFISMWMAFRPGAHKERPHQGPARWQIIVLISTLILTIGGAVLLGRGIALSILEPQFSNDGTSLDTNAAILLLEGRDPYTDSSLSELARHFAIQPEWTTPLRQGQFANRLDYPNQADFQSILDTALKSGHAPEFEEKVSYPSLSFLTLVPFVMAGNYNVLPFYIFCYLAIIFIAWKVAQPAIRPWVLVLALANVPMWGSAVGGNLDVLYVLFLIIAWLFYTKRWTSALVLGLAVASKQIAWYFVPFYAVLIWRHYGFKETFFRLTISGSLALAFNLPFIIWNPQAWLAGVLAPIKDPMFPMGVGIVNMSVAHLIPYFPENIYTVLTYGIAMPLMVYYYWRICRKHPEAVMLLAVAPLFFAWRSLPSYFYCTAFPLYILLTARLQPNRQAATSKISELVQKLAAKINGTARPIGV